MNEFVWPFQFTAVREIRHNRISLVVLVPLSARATDRENEWQNVILG
jgi:hypothetical protein